MHHTAIHTISADATPTVACTVVFGVSWPIKGQSSEEPAVKRGGAQGQIPAWSCVSGQTLWLQSVCENAARAAQSHDPRHKGKIPSTASTLPQYSRDGSASSPMFCKLGFQLGIGVPAKLSATRPRESLV